MIKNFFMFVFLGSFVACGYQLTECQKEDLFVEKYAPKDLNTHGFTLPVDSKIAEVHQLFNDVEANFYFYGDKNEFEDKIQRILELDPEYPSGVLMSGFYVQDPEEYKKLVTRAYELSKRSELKSEQLMMKAEYLLLVKEDYSGAQEYFQKVVDMYPGSPAAIWSLGMAYYYADQYDEAFECFKKSTELIPHLPKGYELMAGVCAFKKDIAGAMKYLDLAKKHGAKTENDIYFAEFEHILYYRNKMYEETMNSIEKAYEFGPQFRNSESLQKTYEAAQRKLDTLHMKY